MLWVWGGLVFFLYALSYWYLLAYGDTHGDMVVQRSVPLRD